MRRFPRCQALQAADPTLLVNQLSQLRTHIAGLEAKRTLADATPAPSDSRLMRVLGALVQVHHDESGAAAPVTDAYLSRASSPSSICATRRPPH